MKFRIFVAVSMLAWGGAASAGIYRWVDAEGNLVYSQTPPPDGRGVEEIRLPGRPSDAPRPETDDGPGAAGEKDSDAGDYDREKLAGMDPALRKQYCEKARRNLQLLRGAGPDVAFVTEKKEIVRLNEEERAKRMRQAEEAAKAYCTAEPQ